MSNKKTIEIQAADDRSAEKTESTFSKEQLLSSERFRERRDIVNALLSSEKQYTINAVEKIINDYMKGQVK